MPNLDAANIRFNALKVLNSAVSVGPIVLGLDHPAHILSRSVSARGIVNLTAFAVADAQARAARLVAKT
jgi:malate dehydrogenase (oxaloacetate-decarboxylating)(NADP+)